MKLPLFNYEKIIIENKDDKKLDIENTMLMLHWIDESKVLKITAENKTALINFEAWKKAFILLNEKEYGQMGLMKRVELSDTYLSMLVKCLLRAEFYNWHIFEHGVVLPESPMLKWENNKLIYSRPIKDLLEMEH